jgi:hypothetical protein
LNTFNNELEAKMEVPGNNIIVIAYLVYLLISVAITVWVARTLYRRGGIFLVDAFGGNAELAASVNHLLVVGFYLINIGYVSLALKTGASILTARAAIELLSDKVGMVLLVLGACTSSTYSSSRVSVATRSRLGVRCLRLRLHPMPGSI